MCFKNSGAHGCVPLPANKPASTTPCEPCALKIPERMALTQPSAHRPYKSVQVRTSPYSLARTLCPAQSALPANRTHSPVLSKFQSTWHTLHQVPIVRPVRQVRPVRHSLPAVSALHNVLCQPVECTLFSGERYAHGARGETLLFPPCAPLSPVCCIEACGTQCGFFKLEALAPFPAGAGNRAA